ncbi:hypothetical protein B0H19DRAFT_1161487 [Mycena capillaripes]|nr:hypothetical protein B0H19DRAFT_1161487 [Mycena capillaripes]
MSFSSPATVSGPPWRPQSAPDQAPVSFTGGLQAISALPDGGNPGGPKYLKSPGRGDPKSIEVHYYRKKRTWQGGSEEEKV